MIEVNKDRVEEDFEKFRVLMSAEVPDNADRIALKMFYNQGVIDTLKYVKEKLNKTK
jgi:hypothetical protein